MIEVVCWTSLILLWQSLAAVLQIAGEAKNGDSHIAHSTFIMGSFQLLLNLASVVLLSYQFKANSATSSFLSTATVTATATATTTATATAATVTDTPTKCGSVTWSVVFASVNITGNTLLAANQLMTSKDNTVGEFSLANNHYVNVPTFATSSIMFAPLLVVGLVPELSDSCVVAQWLVVVAFLVAGAIVDDNLSSLFEVAHYAILSSLLLYLMRKRCLDAKRQIASLLEEKKDLEEQLQSGENRMKHMVANMAHDLKTPLSSFMAGIDLIQQEMGKYENQLMHRDLNKDDVGSLFFTIKESLRTIMNTNSFMLMTINRVLDYAKASKGLKLVPKYETIDLMDTLYLPMNCMKDIQQRISIVLEPLSLEICSHIITDKQWLQENVLCLLSNAVKYSSGGTVTVRVSLEQAAISEGGSNKKSPTRQHRSPTSVAWSPRGKGGVRRSTTVLPDLIDQGNDRVALVRSPSDEHGSSDDQVHLLHIEVEDTGIGMSDQAMSELFSPFKQNQHLAGGTGLGLFSLAQRVEALHGQCGVTHRRDGQQGSLFWFTMPYRPDLAAKKREAIARELDSTARYSSVEGKVDFPNAPLLVLPSGLFECAHELPPPLGPPAISTSSLNTLGPTTMNENIHNQPSSRLRILLVDDSPMILRLTSVMLSKQGYEVTAAENGAIALELIRNRLITLQDAPRILQCNGWQELEPAFDVILTDLQMPVMDGLELVKRLREMEAEINQQFAASNGHGQVLPMSPLLSSRHRKRLKESPESMAEDMPPSPEMRHIVIGLSANSDDETLEQSIQVGIDGFLSKPFAMGAFHQLLDSLR